MKQTYRINLLKILKEDVNISKDEITKITAGFYTLDKEKVFELMENYPARVEDLKQIKIDKRLKFYTEDYIVIINPFYTYKELKFSERDFPLFLKVRIGGLIFSEVKVPKDLGNVLIFDEGGLNEYFREADNEKI